MKTKNMKTKTAENRIIKKALSLAAAVILLFVSIVNGGEGTAVINAAYNQGEYDAGRHASHAAKYENSLMKKAKKAEKILAGEIYKDLFKEGSIIPGMENYGAGLYEVFSLARAGYKCPEFYNKVYRNLVKELKDLKQKGETRLSDGTVLTLKSIDTSDSPMNVYAKAVLAVTALGHDASNPDETGGFNLLEKLLDRKIYESSTKAYQKPVLMLLAVKAGNYKFPKGKNLVTENELVSACIEDAKNQLDNASEYGLDSALIAIQPLSFYVKKNKDAREISDKIIDYAKKSQGKNGGFEAFGNPNNPWTNAQVMITMGCYNISPVPGRKNSAFIKNGHTVIDNVLSYIDLKDKTYDKETINFDASQVLRGLTAVTKNKKGKGLFGR